MKRMWTLGFAVGMIGAFGCSTVPPPGFVARATLEPVEVSAKPLVMYGKAPHAWVGPDGELAVDVEEALVTSGLGGYSADLKYSVGREGSAEPRLRCSFSTTAPGLLACEGSRHAVRFELGRGCRYPQDITKPACVRAELSVNGRRFHLSEGHVEKLGSPSGEVSIVDENGSLVAAANIVAEARIEAWLPTREVAPVERDVALMVFTAYHQWRHRTTPG